MSAAAFDIRIPLGWLFVALGAILVVWGVATPHELYARSLGINVNLIWGAVMLVFGAICLWLARRGKGRSGGAGAGSRPR